MESAEGISVVVSQRWIAGERPDNDIIEQHMQALGFKRTANGQDFFRESDNLVVLDCHPDNFVLSNEGVVVPIDVHVSEATSELKRALLL